ncbi:hypothetical protein KCQ_21760 [Pectobacterium atrosepticum ICMP 1526]|nr:hypothetical protein KCQ_21760 [Pectobacterium atrosepticum ICMP 1526]
MLSNIVKIRVINHQQRAFREYRGFLITKKWNKTQTKEDNDKKKEANEVKTKVNVKISTFFS